MTNKSVDRVQRLLSDEWPAGTRDEVRAWASALGMPDAEIGVFGDHQVAAASEQIWCDEGVPWGVLWFSHHPGAAALESAHRVLAADLLESIGPPIDATDTTAAWRAGEFLVEAYAYFPDERVKRSTHQVSVLRERMAGFVGV